MSETDNYTKELGEVLRTFDVNRFRRFIAKNNREIPKNIDRKDYIQGMMAKMVLARTDMDSATRDQAKQILDEIGWDYEIN